MPSRHDATIKASAPSLVSNPSPLTPPRVATPVQHASSYSPYPVTPQRSGFSALAAQSSPSPPASSPLESPALSLLVKNAIAAHTGPTSPTQRGRRDTDADPLSDSTSSSRDIEEQLTQGISPQLSPPSAAAPGDMKMQGAVNPEISHIADAVSPSGHASALGQEPGTSSKSKHPALDPVSQSAFPRNPRPRRFQHGQFLLESTPFSQSQGSIGSQELVCINI